MVFQLPHHLEALRCMAIERLWDGPQGREPMHDLMGDIMEYCRRPVLTLDCPTETFILNYRAPGTSVAFHFHFIDRGSVYGIYQSRNCLTLCKAHPATDQSPTQALTLCSDGCGFMSCIYYYDEETRELYVLYDYCTLLKHEMASGRTETIEIFRLCGTLLNMIVIGGCLYVGRLRDVSLRTGGAYLEVLCTQLNRTTYLRKVYTVEVQDTNSRLFSIGFVRVPEIPQAIDFFYESNGMMHTVQIDVVSGDVLCSTTAESNGGLRVGMDYVLKTHGLGLLLIAHLSSAMGDGGSNYILRRPRGYKNVAKIVRNGKSLSYDMPIAFDRWTFCCTDAMGRNAEKATLKVYHPYLV